jgi:hypothetical protein
MRNGQNKRMRGRNNNHRKSQNPMTRVYESNGPDVKIRGTPSHIAEKYMQLARDAQASGDPVSAENYYQHAEHYFRLIAAAQEQFRQNNPHFARPETEIRGAADDAFDDGEEDDVGSPMMGGGDTPFGTREPQPFLPRDAQPFPQQAQPQHPHQPQHQPHHQQPQHFVPRHQPQFNQQEAGGDIERLPSFITGPQQASAPQQQQVPQSYGSNGGHENQGDRFPLHRRRRRHRGPRPDMHASSGGDGDESRRGE